MKNSIKILVENCKDPAAEWRGMPFWALNGKLAPDEIRRQIRGFKKNGLGGFFLHARTGLSTPYLSDEWFAAVSAAVDEAEKLDMQPFLYDEDRFPSGSGGGILTADEKHRAKGIFLEQLDWLQAQNYILPDSTVAVFVADFNGVYAKNARRIHDDSWRMIDENEKVAVFYTDTIKCSSWYNNFTYGDTLSEETAEAFIKLTHEKYKKRYYDKFGKIIPGIFTDEPRYGFVLNQPQWDVERRIAMPWTPGLLEYFKQRYNYDVTDRLIELFYQLEDADSTAPRIHYIESLMQFFLKGFIGKCSKWCKENNLILTGHTVGEDSLSYQTLCCGSAMRLYEYMEMPGMDLLTEHHRAYQTAKQVSSVARQFGRTRRLTESYGCTGYDFPILGFKALGDWQYALGINFRCQHLAFYTMGGEAKRDYPCTVANHSNVPEEFKAMEDRFARLGIWLSAGKEKRNILVLSPIESAWSLYHCNFRQSKKVLDFDTEFTMLSHSLLAHHLDFDYGDEDIISRYAEIKKIDGEVLFFIGEAAYRTVVMPHMITVRSSTLKLLQQFSQAGGKVIASEIVPTHVDGFKQIIADYGWEKFSSNEELIDKLEDFRDVSLCDNNGNFCKSLLTQFRNNDDFDVLFVCNTGHDVDAGCGNGADYIECGIFERKQEYSSVNIEIASRKKGEVIEFDFEKCKYYRHQSVYAGGKWHFTVPFGRLQSRLFIITAESGMLECEPAPEQIFDFKDSIHISPACWDYNLSEMNVALFDHFYSTISDNKEYVLQLDSLFRKKIGLAERGDIMAQPWCRKKNNQNSIVAEFYTDFECNTDILGPVSLIMEHPELYTVSINGKIIEFKDTGFWHEKAWRRCMLLDKYLQRGYNRIDFKTIINDDHAGLEAVFLTGPFAVYEKARMINLDVLPDKLHSVNWCEQGFTFYSGNISYCTDVKLSSPLRGAVKLENFYGTPADIFVNDELVDTVFYSPATSKIIDFPAEFKLKISLVGSLRNSCGPFFCKTAQPVWCGPAQFYSVENRERQLMPYGICGDVKILIKDQ